MHYWGSIENNKFIGDKNSIDENVDDYQNYQTIGAKGVFPGVIINSDKPDEGNILPTATSYSIFGVIRPEIIDMKGNSALMLILTAEAVNSYSKTYDLDMDFYGSATLYRKGKLISENTLNEPRSPAYHNPNILKEIGMTSFLVQRGQSYDLRVNLNYILKGDGGVMIHTDNNSILKISFTVK